MSITEISFHKYTTRNNSKWLLVNAYISVNWHCIITTYARHHQNPNHAPISQGSRDRGSRNWDTASWYIMISHSFGYTTHTIFCNHVLENMLLLIIQWIVCEAFSNPTMYKRKAVPNCWVKYHERKISPESMQRFWSCDSFVFVMDTFKLSFTWIIRSRMVLRAQ